MSLITGYLKSKTLLEWSYVHWNCTTDGQKRHFCENPNHVLSRGERVTEEEWNQISLEIELSGHLHPASHEPDDDQRENRLKRRTKRQALKGASKKAGANPTPTAHTGASPGTSDPDPAGPNTLVRGRGLATRGRGFATRGRGYATRGRGYATRGGGLATHGRGLTTQAHGLAARGPGSATRSSTGHGPNAHADVNPSPTTVGPSPAARASPTTQTGDPATYASSSSDARPTISNRMFGFTRSFVGSLMGEAKGPEK